MASACNRAFGRSSLSSIKSAIRSSSGTAFINRSTTSTSSFKSCSSPIHRFSFSRFPAELGCVQSLLPLHNAVAAARMTSCLSTTSRSCRSLSQGTLCCTSPGL